MKRLCEEAQKAGYVVSGFFTDEVLSKSGARVGFDVVTVPQFQRGVLARKTPAAAVGRKWPKTGQYFVDVSSFELLALPTLKINNPGEDAPLFIVDEIGRMEAHSNNFIDSINALLEDKNSVLCGSIAAPRYGHTVPFCEAIKAQEEVLTLNIKKSNREQVTSHFIAESLKAARKACRHVGNKGTKRLQQNSADEQKRFKK